MGRLPKEAFPKEERIRKDLSKPIYIIYIKNL